MQSLRLMTKWWNEIILDSDLITRAIENLFLFLFFIFINTMQKTINKEENENLKKKNSKKLTLSIYSRKIIDGSKHWPRIICSSKDF